MVTSLSYILDMRTNVFKEGDLDGGPSRQSQSPQLKLREETQRTYKFLLSLVKIVNSILVCSFRRFFDFLF